MIRIIGAIVAILLAVGGGFALFLYVQSADKRAAEGAEFQQVFVVKEAVPKGTAGEAVQDFIEVDELPAIAIQPDIVTDLADLKGLVTNAELLPGEQLLQARFSSPEDLAADGEVVIPDGYQEITLALPVERVVGGEVRPGDSVGIVLSTNTRSIAANDQTAQSQFIYNGVLVTRVTAGRTLTSGDSADENREVSAFLVTLAVTASQAEKLAYGAEQQEDNNGGIWLTLQPEGVDTNGSTNRSGENIFQ
ncbi:Flp pilus assembly protein CpaB [Agromyces aurantiacus]|uniref:Flp pilus assembly protein CpaB n=1 Tax=Agromyces aurantiacus TaxID=165814 RepID=A0ABV9R4D8_9MICO|nr:RcpC/CpaB family pilus assembly protein [Agromyces aurantiacus]MBM7503278.1 pilus assembly protein CpaB [Agromyces aurantiacus]